VTYCEKLGNIGFAEVSEAEFLKGIAQNSELAEC
jgi:hypothetical protein